MIPNDVSDYVRVFDTTLRDGEQAPGCTIGVEEKVAMARVIAALGVDVIEAGFAAARAGEPEAIQAVMRAVGQLPTSPVILSLARTRQSDVEMALRAVEGASRPGVHIFVATSPIHLEHKFGGLPFEAALEQMVGAVRYAKQFVSHIEVSAEDATRTPVGDLVQYYRAAIEAGATVCNVPDTTGYATVDEYRALFKRLLKHARLCRCWDKRVPCEHVVWSAHVHDDLGLAVAKSLAAVQGGARQVECTLLGIGERCGNASLEEVVMALQTRQDHYHIATRVEATGLYGACQLLSRTIGWPIPPNKAIVGANAFAHEAGIHQDGVLKDASTYEIMRPESIGRVSNALVLGKHSGQAAVRDRLGILGVDFVSVDLGEFMNRFKELAGSKRSADGAVDDAELLGLLPGADASDRYVLRFASAHTSYGMKHSKPTAHVYLIVDGTNFDHECSGDGIIDAAFQAVQVLTGTSPKLMAFATKSIGHDTDAMGEAVVTLELDGLVVRSTGAHTDVTMAALTAYVGALNKLDRIKRFRSGNGNAGFGEEPTP